MIADTPAVDAHRWGEVRTEELAGIAAIQQNNGLQLIRSRAATPHALLTLR
jgi:hypothetical protein